jgi:hypothetical protein
VSRRPNHWHEDSATGRLTLGRIAADSPGRSVKTGWTTTQARPRPISRRRDWQEAMTAVTTTLFEGVDSTGAMRALVDCAIRASSGAGAAFTAPDRSTQELRVTVAVGVLAAWQGALVPAVGTLAEA